MVQAAEIFTRWGFDSARLRFGIRTGIACFAAIVIAWLIGLEHPQWSGMTVWASSQASRGNLFEKSMFRLTGTIGGTLAGIALVYFVGEHPLYLVIGLSVWIGLCAGIGNLQRGFLAYGTLLAGYSAAMVALLGNDTSQGVMAVGADRLATALVGVITAILFGWFASSHQSAELVLSRVRHSVTRMLRYMAGRLKDSPLSLAEQEKKILAELAALDDILDPLAAGSLKSKKMVRTIRGLLITQMSVLLSLRYVRPGSVSRGFIDQLNEVAAAVESGASPAQLRDLFPRSAKKEIYGKHAGNVLDAFEAVIANEMAQNPANVAATRTRPGVVLHRDWVGGREALLRSGGTILFVGLLWWFTGWHEVTYMILGAAVAISIFSTLENPSRTMRAVTAGQVMGVIGAMLCRWALWPFAASDWQMIVLMGPFILVGAFLYAHRVTMNAGFDYNMLMLLLLQPAYPPTGTWQQSATISLAVIAAPLIAWMAYIYVFPTDATRRMHAIRMMIIQDIQRKAISPTTSGRHVMWRTRLYHRVMRMAVWANKSNQKNIDVLHGGAMVAGLGDIIMLSKELLLEPATPPRLKRSLYIFLKRAVSIADRPEQVLKALRRASSLIAKYEHRNSPMFNDVSSDMAAYLPFLSPLAAKSK